MRRVFAFSAGLGGGDQRAPGFQRQRCGVQIQAFAMEVDMATRSKKKPGEFLIQKPTGQKTSSARYLICFETSLVISNMLTDFLPPKTTLSLSSALICVRFLASWSLFFLM